MGFQNKISKAVANYQRKISDVHVEHLGTEQKLLRLQIDEDKYGDRDYILLANEVITGIISYPNNEIPMTWGTTNTDQTSKGLHLYDLLPIEARFKFGTEIEFGDIIFQRIKTNVQPDANNFTSTNFRLLGLQVVDIIAKGTTEIVNIRYELAPYTLDISSDLPELETIIDDYLAEPWED